MIKNKKITIIITLPIVILVWGYIFLNLSGALSNKEAISEKQTIGNFTKPSFQPREKFVLLPTSMDPFLGTYEKPRKKRVTSTSKKKIDVVPWPQISYHGIVGDNNSSSEIFVVTIEGQQYLLEKGEKMNDLRLINGSETAVMLQFQGKTKKFPLQ